MPQVKTLFKRVARDFHGVGAPSFSLLLSSLKLSDTHVHEPYIQALLGTASHFREVVVLKLRTDAGSATLSPLNPSYPR